MQSEKIDVSLTENSIVEDVKGMCRASVEHRGSLFQLTRFDGKTVKIRDFRPKTARRRDRFRLRIDLPLSVFSSAEEYRIAVGACGQRRELRSVRRERFPVIVFDGITFDFIHIDARRSFETFETAHAAKARDDDNGPNGARKSHSHVNVGIDVRRSEP